MKSTMVSGVSLWLLSALLMLIAGSVEAEEAGLLTKQLGKLTKAESLTIEGRAYFTYWVDIQDAEKQGDGEEEPLKNSFELTRFYFGLKAQLAPWLSIRLTSDVGPEKKKVKTSKAEDGHTHEVDGEQSYQFYIKYAYLDARLAKGLGLRVGVVDNPYNDFIDGYWGYRFVMKNVGDEEKVWDSADLGVQLRYELPGGLGLAAVGAFNGAGYKNATDKDGAKDLWLFFNLTPLSGLGEIAKRFNLAGYVSKGITLGPDEPAHLTYSGTLGYTCSNLTVAYQLLGNGIENSAMDDRTWGMGHGAYLRVGLPAKLGVLGRLAIWDADMDIDKNLKKYQVLAGLGWNPHALFQLAASGLVTWYDDAEDTPETETNVRFLLSSEFRF